jgi:hypothetical protein
MMDVTLTAEYRRIVVIKRIKMVRIPALYSEGFNFQSAQTIQIDTVYGFVNPSIYIQGHYHKLGRV